MALQPLLLHSTSSSSTGKSGPSEQLAKSSELLQPRSRSSRIVLLPSREFAAPGRRRWRSFTVTAKANDTKLKGGAQSSEKPVWQDKIARLSKSSLGAAVKNFPWEKVYRRFVYRVSDLLWIVVKWLAVPVLALSTLSELLYTLRAKKDIFIPLGILTGVLVAKVVGKASLDVVKELQDGRNAWPLMAMGVFFVMLKLLGPYYPSWAAAFLPHVANAGLVQTAFLFRESQRMLG